MDEAEEVARLRLARAEGIGAVTFARLLARYGDAGAAVEAAPRWATRMGPGFALPGAGEARRERDAVLRMGGAFLHAGGPGYPPLLALLDNAPALLAVLGDPATLAAPRAVAVVGARNASAVGRRIAEDIAEGLARAGVLVVSGLARGVDASAHAAALGVEGGGRTVAVLAGGLDVAYPAENAALQARIAEEGGALVAESPLGTAPLARHFPRRNRIVAGLSLGVVVVEAALRSGTLVTARLAVEAGREVYAVPGSPLDPRCQGSNDLLRQGATLCERAEDVLDTLPHGPLAAPQFRYRASREADREPAPDLPPDGADTAQVLDLIGGTPVAVDEVLRRCHLSPAEAQAALLDLELGGRVELLPGNRVQRSPVPGRDRPHQGPP